MSKRRFCCVFVPWCVFALLLGHEVWQIGARYIMRETARAEAAPATGLEHDNLEVLDPFGALKVAADNIYDDEHTMVVTVFNRHFMYVTRGRRGGGDGPVGAHLVRDILGAAESVVSCSVPKPGKKRSYIAVNPRAGPDRGAELLDYDLDGIFEMKLGGRKGKVVPSTKTPVKDPSE